MNLPPKLRIAPAKCEIKEDEVAMGKSPENLVCSYSSLLILSDSSSSEDPSSSSSGTGA